MMKVFTLAAAALMLLGSFGMAAAEDAPISPDPLSVKPGNYVLDSEHGKITWSVSHSGLSTYIGQFTGVEAALTLDTENPEKSMLNATVRTDSVGTFHPGLDEHLKTADFLDVEAFPASSFTATRIEPTGPATARVTGNLTLLAVTRPFSIDVTFNGSGIHPIGNIYKVGFTGRGVLKRSEWGMGAFVPDVGDEVSLEIEGEFRAAEQQGS